MAAMVVEGRRQARFCEAFAGNGGVGELKPSGHTLLGTPPELSEYYFVSGRVDGKLRVAHSRTAFTSSRASVCGRRDRATRKKIIGHGMFIFRERFSGRRVFLHVLRTFPLLHQPASQHGRGIFLHPKVEKRADLLAEIGGMAEAREFVALERVSRSREKELPRRLGFVVVHVCLRATCAN
jgi:hypothetical protein